MENLYESLLVRGSKLFKLQCLSLSVTNYGVSMLKPDVFEDFLIVGLQSDHGTLKPFIQYSFQGNKHDYKASDGEQLAWLVFPDSKYWVPSERSKTYQFAITSLTGERKYAYCRRILPQGSDADETSHYTIPIAYCFISQMKTCSLFNDALTFLESNHGGEQSELPATLQHIKMIHPYYYERSGSFHQDQEITSLDLKVFCRAYAHLLLECKVIFVKDVDNCTAVENLANFVSMFESFLYPLRWEHCLINVVPTDITQRVLSIPTPCLMGVLTKASDKSEQNDWQQLEEGIVLSLDTGCVLFQGSPKSTLELADDLETFLQMNWPINAHQNNPKLKAMLQNFNQNLIIKTETNVKGKSAMEKDGYFRLFSKTAMFELRN